MKIKSARITDLPKNIFADMPAVFATLEGEEKEVQLFFFYPDEISFKESEFIGLTINQALELKHKKDVAYLRSA